jgi:hypothetical protein
VKPLLREAKNDNGKPLFTFVEAIVGYNWSEEQGAKATEVSADQPLEVK